jgi:hypothetical protein
MTSVMLSESNIADAQPGSLRPGGLQDDGSLFNLKESMPVKVPGAPDSSDEARIASACTPMNEDDDVAELDDVARPFKTLDLQDTFSLRESSKKKPKALVSVKSVDKEEISSTWVNTGTSDDLDSLSTAPSR